MDDYHRMLYIFVCLSEKCVSTQNAVHCYRCLIPHDNNMIKFASDEEYDKIYQKTNNQLIAMGYKDIIDQTKKESVQPKK